MALTYLTIANIIAKFTRGIVALFIVYWFGASSLTDTFFVAFSTIMFLYTLLSLPFENNIIPYICEEQKKGWESLNTFMENLLSTSIFVCFLILPAALIFLYFYVNIFIDKHISVKDVLLMFTLFYPFIIISSFNAILRSTLNALEFYGLPTLSIALSSVILVVASAALSTYSGVYGLVMGFVIGEAFSTVFLLYLKRKKFPLIRIGFSLKLKEAFKELEILYLNNVNIISGLTFVWVANFVNISLASHVNAGAVSIYEYSMRMFYLFSEIYGGLYLYKLIKFSVNPDSVKNLDKLIVKIILSGLVLIIPIIIYRDVIVSVLLRKATDVNQIAFTKMLPLFMFGSIAYSASQLTTRWFLAIKNTVFLRNTALIKSLIIILISYILIKRLGMYGLSISIVISEIVTFIILHKKLLRMI